MSPFFSVPTVFNDLHQYTIQRPKSLKTMYKTNSHRARQARDWESIVRPFTLSSDINLPLLTCEPQVRIPWTHFGSMTGRKCRLRMWTCESKQWYQTQQLRRPHLFYIDILDSRLSLSINLNDKRQAPLRGFIEVYLQLCSSGTRLDVSCGMVFTFWWLGTCWVVEDNGRGDVDAGRRRTFINCWSCKASGSFVQ